ncbi:MAG: hypothetical protein A2Y24_00825 [Clostridiales bacterium GWE2_32_10]|nr:MAG: hypothetical protein A2Y24_00825 [Clostridiales bacterium GWE2_32_10]HBY21282.1 hypothetical protein [Clostridiales bacterium]
MIALRKLDNKFVIEFNKNDVSDEFLSKLLIKYKLDKLIEKSEMCDEDIIELSNQVNEEWVKNNQEWLMKKSGGKDEYSN